MTRAVAAGEATCGYWAPELHELHLEVPLALDLAAGESFYPLDVQVNGAPAPSVVWYADGHSIDYQPEPEARGKAIAAFIPHAWRGGETYEVVIRCRCGGAEREFRAAVPAPAGGAWAPCTGGNLAFLIREERGLARAHEPVDLDVTVSAALFPDPGRAVRATVMRAPGVFDEIPVQVCDVEEFAGPRPGDEPGPCVRFRALVQLTLAARAEALVHLWACTPDDAAVLAEGPLRLEGGALGGIVHNADYAIELDRATGQLFRWRDHRLGVVFDYVDPIPERTGSQLVIHRTPDLFPAGAPWSHLCDWEAPGHRTIAGPVLCETRRWGPMPWTPEARARVSYRFHAHRPEVRATSSLRVLRDLLVKALRMGNMIFSRDAFTHVAWPRQDGSVVRIALAQAIGNDMGAPPAAQFLSDTPWVAFYHRGRKIGFALLTVSTAYLADGPWPPNRSQQMAYVSYYRESFLYCIRSAIQSYCADVRTYETPLHAGTLLHEDVAYLPFCFTQEDAAQFQPVEQLFDELKYPLVVVP